MIEQGIVLLVQANTAVRALCPAGGFFVQLPKGQVLPSWTFRVISPTNLYGLNFKPGLSMNRVQIDCYGAPEAQGSDVIQLAKAIDNVLSAYRGTLTDPDSTRVDSCFQSDLQDFFEDANRGYRRMIEYEIWFYQ